MVIRCEVCGKKFKTSQALGGYTSYVHKIKKDKSLDNETVRVEIKDEAVKCDKNEKESLNDLEKFWRFCDLLDNGYDDYRASKELRIRPEDEVKRLLKDKVTNTAVIYARVSS